jgi:ribonuclease HI
MIDIFTLFFDGCSKGNPGPSGAGAVIYKNDIEIFNECKFLGNKETNNVAEYNGLIIGLDNAIKLNISNLIVKGDSNLVINQMKGDYTVKSKNLLNLFNQAKNLENKFNNVEFLHIYRNDNKRADELANFALN